MLIPALTGVRAAYKGIDAMLRSPVLPDGGNVHPRLERNVSAGGVRRSPSVEPAVAAEVVVVQDKAVAVAKCRLWSQ